MGAVRTFIAIMLDASLHDTLTELVGTFASTNASVKWVSPENTHVTLRFLGNVDEERIPEICDACERAARGVSAFDVEIKTVGCFPDIRRPKVVWIGVGKGSAPLRELSRRIEEEFEGIGFARDKRGFKAHLTIGRVKGRQGISELCGLLQKNSDVLIGSMRANTISVMKSKTLPSGPVYTELKAIELS